MESPFQLTPRKITALTSPSSLPHFLFGSPLAKLKWKSENIGSIDMVHMGYLLGREQCGRLERGSGGQTSHSCMHSQVCTPSYSSSKNSPTPSLHVGPDNKGLIQLLPYTAFPSEICWAPDGYHGVNLPGSYPCDRGERS